jgi:hypothetical protein
MTKIGLLLAAILVGIIASEEGRICTREGFYRNPDDCTKFYRCIDLWQKGQQFTVFNFNCPAGTVFDENFMVCNWAYLAPSCIRDSPVEDFETDEVLIPTESHQEIENGLFDIENALSDVDKTEAVVAEEEAVPGVNDETVILTASYNYQCNGEGLFEHAEDCGKFWACELYDGGDIGGQLYVCPDNYWVRKQITQILQL